MSTGVRLASNLDTLRRTEIESLRGHNFALLVDVARNTPVVFGRWPELGAVRTIEDLPELPVLTPAALAAGCPPNSEEYLLRGEQPGMVIRSSGTSSKTKMMYHSWEFNDQVSALGARGLRALPIPPRRVANCLLAAELNGAYMFTHEVVRIGKGRVFPLGSTTSVRQAAEVISEHSVDTLVASPSYGVDLLTTVPPAMLTPLRTFLYIGEELGASRRIAIAESFPTLDVRSLAYSTSETGCIGYQCAYQTGTAHHVHEDAVVVEVVNAETGEPVPEGTAGDVLVTPLHDTGMALFRYQIGDRGRLTAQRCWCGSQAKVLTLLGRSAQSIVVDSETFSTDQLMSTLTRLGVTDPADCQLQILWDVNTYRVRLLLSLNTPEEITAHAVAEVFAGSLELNQVVTGPRCVGFTVERVALASFERTERGKVPTLYQQVASV